MYSVSGILLDLGGSEGSSLLLIDDRAMIFPTAAPVVALKRSFEVEEECGGSVKKSDCTPLNTTKLCDLRLGLKGMLSSTVCKCRGSGAESLRTSNRPKNHRRNLLPSCGLIPRPSKIVVERLEYSVCITRQS